MSWDRVVLLCEDDAHRDFLRGIARARGWRVVDEHTAPRGRGAASQWVIAAFAERLSEIVGGGYPGLGLLAAVDGDNLGCEQRLAALARACVERKVAPRRPQDPVAVLIPTWSLDTWAVFLCKNKVVPEDRKAKRAAASLYRPLHPAYLAPGVPREDAPRGWRSGALAALVTGFLDGPSHDDLPSLDAAREDLAQVSS